MLRIAVMAFLLCLAPMAQAKGPLGKAVKQGLKCYNQLNYGCAIKTLESAAQKWRSNPKLLDDAGALSLWQTLAFSLASVERHDEAQAAFEQCFGVKSDYSLDPKIISPKLYKDYKAARKKTLFLVIKGEYRAPPMPSIVELPVPGARDMRLDVPSLVAEQGPVSEYSNALNVLIGTQVLLGNDAKRYDPGFGIALEYSRSLNTWLELYLMVPFYQHAYRLDDLKEGYQGTLFVLQPSLGVRVHANVMNNLELGFGLLGGFSMMGAGTLNQKVGGAFSLAVSVLYRPVRQLGLGVQLMPTLVLATSESNELLRSLTLPVFARFEIAF